MPVCFEPVVEVCVNEEMCKEYDGVTARTFNDYPV